MAKIQTITDQNLEVGLSAKQTLRWLFCIKLDGIGDEGRRLKIFYDLFKDKLCGTNAVIVVDAADPTVHIDVLQRKIVVHVHLGVTVVTTVDRKERVVDV